MAENTALFTEQPVQSLDELYAKAAEFILTPDDMFKRKLDLIEQAEDMSTSEKIEAMNQVEDRHIADKIIYTVLAISLIVAATPEGRKAIGSAAKNIAASVAPLYSKVAGKMACYFVFI
jgi:hypothetical protein